MTSPPVALTRGRARVLRAAVAGVATGALAMLAHAGAGGSLPGVPAVVAFVLIIGVAAAALAGRERGPLVILALVGAGQSSMHAAVSFASDAAHAHGSHSGHVGPMLAAHVLATVVMVAALTGAERVMFSLVAALAARLPHGLVPPPVSVPPRVRCPLPPPRRTITEFLHRRVHTRRGPPETL